MKLDQAIKRAKLIQSIHPDWYVCGSLGLILKSKMPEREVKDIDFVTKMYPWSRIERLIIRNTKTKDKKWNGDKFGNPNYYKETSERAGYIHLNLGFPESCCLFILREVEKEPLRYSGLEIQKSSHIIDWKKSFNREKDRKDLFRSFI